MCVFINFMKKNRRPILTAYCRVRMLIGPLLLIPSRNKFPFLTPTSSVFPTGRHSRNSLRTQTIQSARHGGRRGGELICYLPAWACSSSDPSPFSRAEFSGSGSTTSQAKSGAQLWFAGMVFLFFRFLEEIFSTEYGCRAA